MDHFDEFFVSGDLRLDWFCFLCYLKCDDFGSGRNFGKVSEWLILT